MWRYFGQKSFPMDEREYLEHLEAIGRYITSVDKVQVRFLSIFFLFYFFLFFFQFFGFMTQTYFTFRHDTQCSINFKIHS